MALNQGGNFFSMFTTSTVIYHFSYFISIVFYILALNVRNYNWPLGGAADFCMISTYCTKLTVLNISNFKKIQLFLPAFPSKPPINMHVHYIGYNS